MGFSTGCGRALNIGEKFLGFGKQIKLLPFPGKIIRIAGIEQRIQLITPFNTQSGKADPGINGRRILPHHTFEQYFAFVGVSPQNPGQADE